RDQILRFGICPTVPASSRPAACADASLPMYTAANMASLTAATTVKYVVTTRGIPVLVSVDNSSLYSPGEATSVDNYLRFWLARYITQDTTLSFGERNQAIGFNGYSYTLNLIRQLIWRTIIPATDREYIIGRIDNIDLAGAKSLIDRAINAEAAGIY